MNKEQIEVEKPTLIATRKRNNTSVLGFVSLLMLSANSAYAASGTIPWQTPFQNLISWMSNDTAKWVLTLVIVGAGLAFAVGETGGFFRRCAGGVLGGAIALQAATWSAALFGY